MKNKFVLLVKLKLHLSFLRRGQQILISAIQVFELGIRWSVMLKRCPVGWRFQERAHLYNNRVIAGVF